MIKLLYEQIGNIFGKNVVFNEGPPINFLINKFFDRERDIDKKFKKITDIKYQEYNYDFYDENFFYRASSWILSISNSDKTDLEKIEIIKNATYILINDINVQDKIFSILNKINELTNNFKSNVVINNLDDYFSPEKIEELKNISSKNFDLSKLIKILEEVNICYNNACYLSISSLLRMLIDHIPPIFGLNSFQEVVASYKFSKSDKENMKHLLGAMKNISDGNLHSHISKKEVLPKKQTIEFRADFDVLLKNIIIVVSKI